MVVSLLVHLEREMSEATLLGPSSATLAINTARLAVLAADRIEAVLLRPARAPGGRDRGSHGVPRT